MTTYQWFVFFLIVQLIHGLGTWKLYEKAGRKPWEAFIPVYNSIVLMKIIKRPTWWTFLLFLPVINLLFLPVVWIETLRSFGKNSQLDTILGVVTFGFYIYYVNYTQDVQYLKDRSLKPKSAVTDTLGSLTFAVIVATFVHTYFIQPFTIPTSSLEKSLLVGDFLFVSKFNYGARVPMTTVAAPMVHDTIPFIKKRSYSKWPQLPYMRFPGYETIKNNDIVVFNWPTDTVYYFRDALGRHVDKPIDKKSNYVKRCVGIPGDKIEIKNSVLYVNDKIFILSNRAKTQFSYIAKYKPSNEIDYQQLFIDLNNYKEDRGFRSDSILYFPALTEESVNKLKNTPGIFDVKKLVDTTKTNHSYEFKYNPNIKDDFLNLIERIKQSERFKVDLQVNNIVKIYNLPTEIYNLLNKHKSVIKHKEIIEIFPNSKYYSNWTKDNLGPIFVPKAKQIVNLNFSTLPFYKRIITEYEGKKLEIKGSDIYINGSKTTSYTFDQDYYWMMGDNRHNSEDSRYWGFVPYNHIVGKPVFIWMSIDGINGPISNWKIRWDRLFTTVSGEGEPKSYFRYFLALLALYFVGEYFWKKRKVNKEV